MSRHCKHTSTHKTCAWTFANLLLACSKCHDLLNHEASQNNYCACLSALFTCTHGRLHACAKSMHLMICGVELLDVGSAGHYEAQNKGNTEASRSPRELIVPNEICCNLSLPQLVNVFLTAYTQDPALRRSLPLLRVRAPLLWALARLSRVGGISFLPSPKVAP
jgi:hypothetical protein